MKKFTVSEAAAGSRLDIFIAEQYPQFTRSSLESLFDQGSVQLNGNASKASAKVKTNDSVLLDDELLTAEPPEVELPIIYEDDDVIVINKPDGLLTHSKGALNLEASVASFIKAKLNDENLIGNRAGIVHRLDRHTSGVIITAKTEAAQKWLQKQFSTRKVIKSYLAIIEGGLEPEKALIDAPIARNPNKPQTFIVSRDGKPAQTEYETLKQFQKSGKTYSMLKLSPRTGRTHQLRVHLAFLGHPIVGDYVYGKDKYGKMLLHALSLELALPDKNRRIFESPVPDKIKDFDG
jgi:23S rRNA pseudouridine1911/1915/1917 synthase